MELSGFSLAVGAVILLVASLGIQSFGSSENTANLAAQDGFITSSDETHPRVVIGQEDLTVTASSAGLSDVSWKHKILDAGDFCGRIAFAVAPNHPAIHDSNRLTLPDSAESQSSYRNRFVCFEAAGSANAFDGESWTHYGVWRIDLGHPVISIKAETSGSEIYLQASSSEDVTYEVVKYTVHPIGRGGGGGDYGEQLAVANVCELDLATSLPNARSYWDDWQSFADADGRVLVPDDSYNYCFKATDADGNYVYLGARSDYVGRISTNQWQGQITFNFRSTSGTVAWKVVGSLADDTCNEDVINGARASQRQTLYRRDDYWWPSTSRAMNLPDNSDGKYYCVQATDQLDQRSYLSVLSDLRPPDISIELDSESGLLQVTSNKRILNPRIVGPLAEGEFEDCDEIFAVDEDGRYGSLWWERGERTETTIVDLEAEDDQYYCVEIEDFSVTWQSNNSKLRALPMSSRLSRKRQSKQIYSS